MSDMITADGSVLPKPVRREVHRHGFYKASLSTNVEISFIETEHLNFITFARGDCTPEWEWVATEFLGGLVALRIEQGWAMVSMTDTVAVLKTAG